MLIRGTRLRGNMQVLVLGKGKSGVSANNLLLKLGYETKLIDDLETEKISKANNETEVKL